MALANKEPHYWRPVKQIWQYLDQVIPREAKVLDVGPGPWPFPRAQVVVDFQSEAALHALWDKTEIKDRPQRIIQCDFADNELPFDDNSFDFVYCRHTIEDMYNPFGLLREMSRVGKFGYVETPSPLAEFCRGVDAFENGTDWRGYYHHRFVVWSNDKGLNLVSKYPIIEHLKFDDDNIDKVLRSGPEFWNTYYLWNDDIEFKHWQNPLDFDFGSEYTQLLWRAMTESIAATEVFGGIVNATAAKAA